MKAPAAKTPTRAQRRDMARHELRKSAPLPVERNGTAPGCACGGGCPRCRKNIAIQAKLAVSEPGDSLEREADRIADQMMRSSAARDADSAAGDRPHGRDSAKPDAPLSVGSTRMPQQASPAADEAAALADVTDYVTASRGAGRGLPRDTRGFFESRFGRSFGGVRVHDDAASADAADAIGARAFTAGEDVYFARGEYGPHSASGRKLLAHELVHTLQQAPGAGAGSHGRAGAHTATPTAIQRAPKDADKAEIAWATVHMDLGKSEIVSDQDVHHLWNFAIGQSKLKKAHREFLQSMVKAWIAYFQANSAELEVHGRASSSGKEENNVELSCQRNAAVTGFLKDNGFPAKYITNTVCHGSTDPVPGTELLDADDATTIGAKMARNRSVDLVIRSPYVIVHKTGTTYVVPGFKSDEKEFGASGASSSLLAPAKPRAGRPITGGFKTDLDVDVGFATGVDTTAAKDVDALVKSNADRIDKTLVPVLRHIAEDKFVLAALKSFLETEKGKIEAWSEGGHYDGDKSPPTLSIGTSKGEEDTRRTFVHELLHYVFDKSDSVVGEAKDSGGADHPAVIALETRFLIIDLIRSGKSPLDPKIDSAFGMFLKGDDYFALMNDAIAKDDRAGLKALVAKPEFMKAVVSTGLLPEVSKTAVKYSGGDHYYYTPDQLRDLAFIWAQNAAIVRHAMKTAAAVADSTNTPLKDVFAKPEWQKQMNTFLSGFVMGLRKGRTKGVTSLEAGL